MIRISEQVRRLEDTITSLRRDNQELRDKLKEQESPQKEFMITYKGQVTELPTEGNKEGDMYIILYKDRITGKIITNKWIRYKNIWRNPIEVERMIADSRNEIIDHQNQEIAKLNKELGARVEQVENLQDTLKKITKENLELQEKLNTGCCNKRCKKTTRDEDEFYNDNFRRMFKDFLHDDMF